MKTWITPIAALCEFVTHYVVLDTGATPACPMVATTEVVLGFMDARRRGIFDHRLGKCRDIQPVVVVGPRTRHWVDILPTSGFNAIFVTFTPGGFSRLFGVDVSELADQAYPGEAVIGADVLGVRDTIGNATSVRARIAAIETFLLRHAATARALRPTDRAARALKLAHGRLELGQLVDASGVSDRQFRREFRAHLGMSPKHFAKVLRFEYALRLKDSAPWMSWAQVSQNAGYYDQMHLVKDCKSLGAGPPTDLVHLATNPLLTLSDESLPAASLTLRRA